MYRKLTKLFIKENFSFKRFFGFNSKKSKTKAILIGLAIAYGFVAFFGSFGYMFFNFGEILDEMGQIKLLLSFLTVYMIGLSVILVLLRASGYLFYYKDYDILAPLPIHPRTVLFSKVTVLLIMLYASSFILTLPMSFAYFYWTGFKVISILFYLIAFFFIPLIPVIVMSFLSLLIAIATARFRSSKLITIILLFVLVFGIMAASFSVNEVDANPLTGQIDLFAGLSRAYPPTMWFMNAIHDQSILYLALLVGSHAILFGVFIVLIQGLVQRTNQRGIRSNIRKNNKAVKYQSKSVVQALVFKEFKKFFNSIIYALNSGLGAVLMIVLSVVSLFYKTQIENYLLQFGGAGLDIEVIILAFIGLCIIMTMTPAISLSLEGKNFWIIKSLPIKAETVVFSKILYNLLLCVPIAIVSILLFGISMGFSLVNQVILSLLVIVFAVLVSTLYAIVNMFFPKFDYVNEAEVVKQSAGAMLGLLGGFSLIALNGVFYYFMSDTATFSVIALLLIGINFVLAVPLIYYVKTKSEYLFSKMKA